MSGVNDKRLLALIQWGRRHYYDPAREGLKLLPEGWKVLPPAHSLEMDYKISNAAGYQTIEIEPNGHATLNTHSGNDTDVIDLNRNLRVLAELYHH